MSLSKQIITDKIETCRVLDHYVLQVRDAIQVLENNEVISQKYKRYVLNPDADVTAISDPVVLAQFNAIMTSEVKDNYAKFLKEQEESSE